MVKSYGFTFNVDDVVSHFVIEMPFRLDGRKAYFCRCVCGNFLNVREQYLISKRVTSCGCMRGKANRTEDIAIGSVFGRLTVIKEVRRFSKGIPYIAYECVCDCGNGHTTSKTALKSEDCRSCGCLKKEVRPNLIHGESRSKLYGVWINMKNRCSNPNIPGYQHYGGRGISVCKEWAESFSAFSLWADISGYRTGLTIERNDVNGNYEPSNCSWATCLQQMCNRRDSVRNEEGVALRSLYEKSTKQVSYGCFIRRIVNLGWNEIDAARR